MLRLSSATMQERQLNEFKKVATIGYLVSGLGLGLWSSALLPRLNLAVVGAVASSVGLAPIRKRQTEQAIEEARKQLELDHADRREQIKDWEKELQERSVDLDSRQMDLDRQLEQVEREAQAQQIEYDRQRQQWERESQAQQIELDRQRQQWEQERTIADQTADAEWESRFAMRQKEIEQEYTSLDIERKSIEADRKSLELERDRMLADYETERDLVEKAAQETVHTGLADLDAQRQEMEVQSRQWVADALEPLHEEIASLQSENEALTQQLAVATYPKIPRGIDRVCIYLKEVIPALYKLGFKMDYDHHDTNPNRDRVWFRPQNTFDIKELDKQSGLIQGLIGSKHPLSWRWIEKGLIELEVSTAGVETTTRTSTRKVADRIVDGQQWLIDLVRNCYHFRIAGENGSGKSEFFNNLYCIAKHLVFEGNLDLTLIDPKFPMSRWIIEGQPFIPQYRSWESAVNGVEAMAKLVNTRLETSRENFDPSHWVDEVEPNFTPSMWALDETDTTMAEYKNQVKPNLRVGLKVGRALKVMVAYMCQSPLPDDVGMRRPDLQASASILLSSTAEIGLETLVITPQRKLELREEIAYLNEQGCKYFALVNYSGVDPFIAKLPKPKAYAHLGNLSAAQGTPAGDVEGVATPNEDEGVARVTPLSYIGCGDLGDKQTTAEKPDLGGVKGSRGRVSKATFAPNQEATQAEIDRVEELYNSGIKNQATIIKMVWGCSRNGRKGSKYQRKVEVVKQIKASLSR